jgi:hypothetical protein
VWAITNDSRVWYRKGIDQNLNEGICWVKLNTFMFSVSVTPNDQVNSANYFKISRINNDFYFNIDRYFQWA